MDVSRITDYLFLGVNLRAEELRNFGVRLIISMIGLRRSPQVFDQSPFRLLRLQIAETSQSRFSGR